MSKNQFNDAMHEMVASDDGSFTAYSKAYDEHYHSTKDGALRESLNKHVIPCFSHLQARTELNILDICFGLGFNTLATLYYVQKEQLDVKLNIYSPELDGDLIRALAFFNYPDAFEPFFEIIKILSQTHYYADDTLCIELFVGDARGYLKNSNIRFDIIYQDAFSPRVNPVLWTKEYFSDIARCIKDDGVLSTYSTAFSVRMALYENGFNLYLYEAKGCRPSTIASKSDIPDLKKVDMAHKIACNPNKKSLRDSAF